MTQFGMRFSSTSEWVISKRMFRGLNIPERTTRPLEGDLLMIGPSGGVEEKNAPQFTYSLFEITYVKHEYPNWSLGRYRVYQVTCQLYTPSYDKFETGSPDIDRVSVENDNKTNLALASNLGMDKKKVELLDFSENNPFSGL